MKGMVIYMFDLDLQSRTPIYEQLYKKTIELIIKGVLKENEQLPSVRSLAKEIGVNRILSPKLIRNWKEIRLYILFQEEAVLLQKSVILLLRIIF